MEIIRDLVYDPKHPDRCTLDVYLPNENTGKLLVYIHGGGLESGDKSDFTFCAKELAGSGVSVASVNYRTYPEASFPQFIQDCARAIAYLTQNVERLGGIEELFIGGSSAGAYISMMLYFDRTYLQEVGLDPGIAKGYIFDAGQPTTHFRVLQERGDDPRLVRIDRAAPLFFIDRDVEDEENLPRFLLVVAQDDLPNRLEQTYLLRRTMLHFGYPEKNIAMHIFENSTHTSYIGSKEYLKLLVEFMK